MGSKHTSLEDKLAATADYLEEILARMTAVDAKLAQLEAQFDVIILKLTQIATNTTPKK